MKYFSFSAVCLLMLAALVALACQWSTAAAPTPRVLQDTFFSGQAYIDANGDEEIDQDDTPLAGAQFVVAGFGAKTDASGHATIVIPGGWSQPVGARMLPPEGSGYTLIGPSEAVLQNSGPTSAEFLFAPPLGAAPGEPGEQATPASAAAASLQPTTPAPSLQPSQTPLVLPTLDPASRPGARRPTGVQRDITYCTSPEGVKLLMDIYPAQGQTGPTPAVLYVHGGGWTGGDKAEGSGAAIFALLQQRGYLVASINYRLAPEYKFPAQIIDVKCAVRYLRANAPRYDLDPQRIGAIGGSAGGHLVALLGTTGAEVGWDVGEYTNGEYANGEYTGLSSRVQAVVDMFGPSDLTQMVRPGHRGVGLQVFGLDQAGDPRLTTFSPVTYITDDDPPFLILHGDQDQLVPLEQSQILYDRLKAAGVPAELVVVKNAGHAFRQVGEQEIQPSLFQIAQLIVQFLDNQLKK